MAGEITTRLHAATSASSISTTAVAPTGWPVPMRRGIRAARELRPSNWAPRGLRRTSHRSAPKVVLLMRPDPVECLRGVAPTVSSGVTHELRGVAEPHMECVELEGIENLDGSVAMLTMLRGVCTSTHEPDILLSDAVDALCRMDGSGSDANRATPSMSACGMTLLTSDMSSS